MPELMLAEIRLGELANAAVPASLRCARSFVEETRALQAVWAKEEDLVGASGDLLSQ